MVTALALSAIALGSTAAASTQPFLGRGEAKAAAEEGLARYYGAEWRYGQQRVVKVFYRISRSHLQVEYEFYGEEGGYTWGDVIVWRNRFGELWYHVRPHR